MDGLVLHLFAISCASLLVCMVDDLSEVFRHLRIKDVKEIFTWWPFAFGIHGGEIPKEISIFLHVGPEVLNGKLVEMRHRDELHLRLVEQILVFSDYCLQEIFVDNVFRRQIELYCRGVRQKANEYLRCWSK